MKGVTLGGKWRGARPWALASLVCLAASPAWAAAEASYAGALAAEFFGPFGFAAGSGIVSCVSGHCRLHCSGGTACTTDPPATGPSAPFGGAVLLDAAVDVVKTERGFTADFHITSENNTSPNGSTQGLDWGSSGLTVEVYVPLAAGQEVVGKTAYSLSANWTNAEKGARVSVGLVERCDAGGRAISSPGSGTSSNSLAGNINCVLAVDGSKTIDSNGVTFRLVQRVSFGMSAGFRFNDMMRSGGNGHLEFSFKAKGKEFESISGPTEGLEDADPSFQQPFIVRVFQNDTNANLADETVVFSLKNEAGNVVQTKTKETGADGRATENFAIADPGSYSVEAACVGCVVGSPVVFPITVQSHPDTARLLVQSQIKTGVAGEARLRRPFVVQVVDNDGKPITAVGFSVGFEMAPTGSCPAGTFPETPSTITSGPYASAQTHIKVGNAPGSCRVRASCPQCLAGPEVFADFTITGRPESQIDGGEPGNPFSRSGGGPTPTPVRRKAGSIGIQYKLGHEVQFHRTLAATPESGRQGYVAALTGDTINFRFEPDVSEAAPWKDSLGFEGFGHSIDRSYSTASADRDSPTIVSAQTSAGDERVRILIEDRPTGPGALLGQPGEIIYFAALLETACPLLFSIRNCLGILRATWDADAWASEAFDKRGPAGSCGNGCCNAAKHVYWSAWMTHLTSAALAKGIGIQHEGAGLFQNDSHNTIVMDLQNNSLGQRLGTNAPESALGDLVKAAIIGGQALVFEESEEKLSLLVRSDICGD